MANRGGIHIRNKDADLREYRNMPSGALATTPTQGRIGELRPGVGVITATGRNAVAQNSEASTTHAYFNMLAAHPKKQNAVSLRSASLDAHDIRTYQSLFSSGFASLITAGEYGGSYLYPGNDDYSNPQDASRLKILAWLPDGFGAIDPAYTLMELTAPISASDLTIQIYHPNGFGYGDGFPSFKFIDTGEVVQMNHTVISGGPTNYTLQMLTRGWENTDAAPHAAGALITSISDKLGSQPYMPISGTNGHSYFITWDAWYAPECMFNIQGHNLAGKMFQFCEGDTLQLQVRCDSNEQLTAGVDMGLIGWLELHHGTTGPNTITNPSHSQIEVYGQGLPTRFRLYPSRWTRFYAWIDMHNSDPDWDIVHWWIADEVQEPQEIVGGAEITFSNNLGVMRFEFDSSRARLDPGEPVMNDPRYVYVRNYAVLKDATLAEVEANFLVKPLP